MAGYAIQVRIVDVRPRRAQAPVDRARPLGHGATDHLGRDAAEDSASVVIDRVPTRPRSERLERIHEIWSQLTFYLFDPDGWR